MKQRGDTAVNEAEWDRVKTRLKQEFGETAFKSWVKPITPTTIRDGEVELAVPTRFMRDWITTHYADRIRALWSGENPSVRRVTLKVANGSDLPVPALARGTNSRANLRPRDGKDVTELPAAGPAGRSLNPAPVPWAPNCPRP